MQVKNLASHALSLATKRLARDWRERYGIEPVLVETFVKHGRFIGTSYRAANALSETMLVSMGDREADVYELFHEAFGDPQNRANRDRLLSEGQEHLWDYVKAQPLTKLGREVPDVPCTIFFEEAEWKALVAYKTQNPVPPENPPTLREALHMVASLAGFLGRKSDGEPGTKSLWLGLQRLEGIENRPRH